MTCMRQFRINFECEICGLDTKSYSTQIHRCVECGRIKCANCRQGDFCINCYEKLTFNLKKEFEQKRIIWRLLYTLFAFGTIIFTIFLFMNKLFSHPKANLGIGGLFLVMIGFIGLNKYYGWIHGPLYHVAEHLAAQNFSFLREKEKAQSNQVKEEIIDMHNATN